MGPSCLMGSCVSAGGVDSVWLELGCSAPSLEEAACSFCPQAASDRTKHETTIEQTAFEWNRMKASDRFFEVDKWLNHNRLRAILFLFCPKSTSFGTSERKFVPRRMAIRVHFVELADTGCHTGICLFTGRGLVMASNRDKKNSCARKRRMSASQKVIATAGAFAAIAPTVTEAEIVYVDDRTVIGSAAFAGGGFLFPIARLLFFLFVLSLMCNQFVVAFDDPWARSNTHCAHWPSHLAHPHCVHPNIGHAGPGHATSVIRIAFIQTLVIPPRFTQT